MITKEEIENIALLSKLYVAEEDLAPLTAQLERMVEFADAVSSADVTELETEDAENSVNVYREDAVLPSLPVADVLINAPESADGHFLVRKRA